MDVRIRPATRDDAPLLFELIRQLAVYERREDDVLGSEALLAEHLFGPRPFAEAAIAEADGAPAGFALWFPTFSTFLTLPGVWLEDLFVVPERRRRGIGRALLAHVAALTLARGCARFEWSALDWNEPALALYRSLGARTSEEWITHRLDGEALRALAAQAG